MKPLSIEHRFGVADAQFRREMSVMRGTRGVMPVTPSRCARVHIQGVPRTPDQ